MENPLIEFRNFSLNLDGKQLLDDISLKVEEKSVLLIYGPRSSGKSALLRSIVHLNEELFDRIEFKGDIFFHGQSIINADRKSLRRKIAYIDTSFIETLSPLTVNQIITLVKGRNVDLYSDEMIGLLKRLGLINILKEGLHTYVEDLHGNVRVLFLLLLAILREPEVISLDCIIDHLDDEAVLNIQNIVLSLKQKYTLILATRKLPHFLPIADKIIVMKDGKIKFEGTKKELVFDL
ncbi:MAG: ABC transporter [Mesoaciditoga sp.]|uniref:ATP-binding cassette domain-containing protein n=1 Tax=Athalassotoga sp. TaxID=2022597 RepID=UPI000CA8FE06|nr:MAG: ABC transporter [Mesoaciditoga sp.]PMP80479.1 MAG: ABC transporter [Mesoaciditoga sp.]HEU23722.1 ATP-binding cassette domain-containing protein [Mesoaciditoga lauensis]